MKSRLTVVENVYHQRDGQNPQSVESLFWRELISDEQMLSRPVVVGPTWEQLQTWWIKDAGMLVIQNMEGKLWTVNPTDDQLHNAQSKVIEVAFCIDPTHIHVTPDIEIPWKESARFKPSDVKRIWVRCRNGSAHATISVIPS